MSRLVHPLACSNLSNWVRLFAQYGGINAKSIPASIIITLANSIRLPLYAFEALYYRKAILQAEVSPPPLFILGHWRSGTTYLHDLMSRDPKMSSSTFYQSLMPWEFLSKIPLSRIFFKQFIPLQRPMDRVELTLDGPQEEELAMANMCLYSFFHCIYFPRNMNHIFRRCVLFEDTKTEEINEWKEYWLYFIKKVGLQNGGQNRLIIKNPANTARIGLLLGLFPNAKFVYIYRNPYIVFLSMKNFFIKMLEQFSLQNCDMDELEKNILIFYRQLLGKYFLEKRLIPQENIVELRFESLEERPLEELHRIYTHLGLDGFAEAEPSIRAHVDSVSNYKKNTYKPTEKDIYLVQNNWKMALDCWDYRVP